MTVQEYGAAVRATVDREGEALKRTRKLAKAAQATYEQCRLEFIAHESDHGCAPVKTAGTTGQDSSTQMLNG